MKKFLYNLYLCLTIFLGLGLMILLLFVLPMNFDIYIENEYALAFNMILFTIVVLMIVILCSYFSDKIDKIK